MTWTKDTIGTASYTKDTKPSGLTTYLLMEDGYRLLQEDGSPIVLTYSADYTNDTIGSGNYTNDTK